MHPNVYLKTFWNAERRPTVFVAMSFSPTYESRFKNVFAPAISSISVNDEWLKPVRVDESKSGDSILTEIVDGICHSALVLADVSTMGRDSKNGNPYRNGNVMYEVGIALACRQPSEVLMIRDDKDPFLFDVSSIPHMMIDFTDEESAVIQLQSSLQARIEETNIIRDARIKKIASQLGPAELRVLRLTKEQMVDGRGSLTTNDTAAYSRLVELGVFSLNLMEPFTATDNPNYVFTEFGIAVSEILFRARVL